MHTNITTVPNETKVKIAKDYATDIRLTIFQLALKYNISANIIYGILNSGVEIIMKRLHKEIYNSVKYSTDLIMSMDVKLCASKIGVEEGVFIRLRDRAIATFGRNNRPEIAHVEDDPYKIMIYYMENKVAQPKLREVFDIPFRLTAETMHTGTENLIDYLYIGVIPFTEFNSKSLTRLSIYSSKWIRAERFKQLADIIDKVKLTEPPVKKNPRGRPAKKVVEEEKPEDIPEEEEMEEPDKEEDIVEVSESAVTEDSTAKVEEEEEQKPQPDTEKKRRSKYKGESYDIRVDIDDPEVKELMIKCAVMFFNKGIIFRKIAQHYKISDKNVRRLIDIITKEATKSVESMSDEAKRLIETRLSVIGMGNINRYCKVNHGIQVNTLGRILPQKENLIERMENNEIR